MSEADAAPIWSVSPRARRRIMEILLALLAWQAICMVPVPGIDLGILAEALAHEDDEPGGTMPSRALGLAKFRAITLGALGVMPYCLALVVGATVAAIFPGFRRRLEGSGGRRGLERWAGRASIALAGVMGWIMVAWLTGPGDLLLVDDGFWTFVVPNVAAYMAMAAVVARLAPWLGHGQAGLGLALLDCPWRIAGLLEQGSAVPSLLRAGAATPGHVLLAAALIFLICAVGAAVGHAVRTFSADSTAVPGPPTLHRVPLGSAAALILIASGVLASLEPRVGAGFGLPDSGPRDSLHVGIPIWSAYALFVTVVWSRWAFDATALARRLQDQGAALSGVRPGVPTRDALIRTCRFPLLLALPALLLIVLALRLLATGVLPNGPVRALASPVPWLVIALTGAATLRTFREESAAAPPPAAPPTP